MTIIAAITNDMALGKGGDMIYHISADLRRFKQITMGHPLVMGRRTFESFPSGPLPGRRNIVVSGNASYRKDGIEVFPSLEEALLAAGPDAMIIGGGQIYAQAIGLAQAMEITEIDADSADADTFFPEISPLQWRPVETSPWQVDPKTGVRFRYVRYERFAPPIMQ